MVQSRFRTGMEGLDLWSGILYECSGIDKDSSLYDTVAQKNNCHSIHRYHCQHNLTCVLLRLVGIIIM